MLHMPVSFFFLIVSKSVVKNLFLQAVLEDFLHINIVYVDNKNCLLLHLSK